MRKKIYTMAYFLINYNTTLANSLGIRVKYTGLNLMVGGYALGRYFLNVRSLNLRAVPGEQFE